MLMGTIWMRREKEIEGVREGIKINEQGGCIDKILIYDVINGTIYASFILRKIWVIEK